MISKDELATRLKQIQSYPVDERNEAYFALAEQLKLKTKGIFNENQAFLDDFWELLKGLPLYQQIEILRYFVQKGPTQNRSHYIYQLSLTKDPESLPLFLEMAQSQSDDVFSAAYALQNYSDLESINTLGDLLLNSKSAKVRYIAAGSLGMIGDEKAVPFLMKALDDDENAEFLSAPSAGNPVYESVVYSLNKITGKNLSVDEWRMANSK